MHGTHTTEPAADTSVPPLSAAAGKPKGIAVLGSHPATVMQAPFNDGWLIYACSPHNFEQRQLPRWDEWFEVHIPLADKTRAYPYLKFLEGVPRVWMRDKQAMPFFRGAREYPEAQMKQEFGPFTFTSSIAFILAKAIKDCETYGIAQIGLFGIMQATPSEYSFQRPGIQNLIWEATKRKIKVLAPQASKLFEPPAEDF